MLVLLARSGKIIANYVQVEVTAFRGRIAHFSSWRLFSVLKDQVSSLLVQLVIFVQRDPHLQFNVQVVAIVKAGKVNAKYVKLDFTAFKVQRTQLSALLETTVR